MDPHLDLSDSIISSLVLFALILSNLFITHLVLSYLASSYLVLSYLLLSCLITSYLILSPLHLPNIDREVEMRIRNLSGQLIMACSDGKNPGEGSGAGGKKKHGDTKQYNR